MMIKDPNDYFRIKGAAALKQKIDVAIAAHDAGSKRMLEDAQSKKAAASSEEDAAHTTETSNNSINDSPKTGNKKSQYLAEPMIYGGDRFEILPTGIFYVETNVNKEGGIETEHHFVCSPIVVEAMTRTNGGRAWGRLLKWHDPDGKLHQWAMPMELLQGDCADVRRELADKGVQINPSKRGCDRLAIYLQNYPIKQRALCVERLGWHGDVFVMPNRVIGDSQELTVFQNPYGIESTFSQSGTVEQWRDTVARYAMGNSRFTFVLSFSFAAPLAVLVDEQGGGIHLRGGSSTGKSTLLDASCSTYGKPRNYKREWRTTGNALEGLAALHNDGLLVLDEINQCDFKTIGQTIYMLANGQAKARMTKNLTTRPSNIWRVMFLSSGEKSLSDMMKLAGQQINAGQEIRLADIPAEVAPKTVFEKTHGTEDHATFSKMIVDATNKYHGTVGLEWIDYIASNRIELISVIRTRIAAFVAANVPKGASGQVVRVAGRFGLIAASGELATERGLTGWPTGAANEAAVICFNDWLTAFGGIGNHEDRAILASIKAFFEAHGSSRFESCHITDADKPERINNRAGYWKQDVDGKRFLVFPEQFNNEVCKGFDKAQVIRVLDESAILMKGNDKKPTQVARIPDLLKPIRMYVINADILFSEGNQGNAGYSTDYKEENLLPETVANEVTKVTTVVPVKQTKTTDATSYPCYPADNQEGNNKNNNKINNVTHVTFVTQDNDLQVKNSFIDEPDAGEF